MSKIVLADLSSFANISGINDNFTKIEDTLNNKVLWRDNPDGYPNQMENALDMNSNDIINAGLIRAKNIVAESVSSSDKFPIAGGLHDNEILKWDKSTGQLVGTGLHSNKIGELTTSNNSVNIGVHDVGSAGRNIIITNRVDNRHFYTTVGEIGLSDANTRSALSRVHGNLEEYQLYDGLSNILADPVWSTTTKVNRTVLGVKFWPQTDMTNVVYKVFDRGTLIYEENLGDFSAGNNSSYKTLKTPYDLYTDSNYTFSLSSLDGTTHWKGDDQGRPWFQLQIRTFALKPLATEEFVLNNIGTGNGDMLKSVYDTDNDGKVDSASVADTATAITGVQGSGNNSYYGKDGTGSVGFHSLPDVPDTTGIETEIQEINRKVGNTDTLVNALSQRMAEFQDYFVYIGRTPPTYPDRRQNGYFCIMSDLTQDETVTLPSKDRFHDGALFFIKNEDPVSTVRIEAPEGDKVNSGRFIDITPQTAAWLVHKDKNWWIVTQGYMPKSYSSFIDDIKSHAAGGSLGITVDDGTTNYGDIKLLKLKGITADRPSGDSIDSVTLTAENSWGTLGDASSNVKGSIVLTEPPLQAYADPNDVDTVRLRLEPGTFEEIHAPGYLAYINSPITIVGKAHTATSHADGAIYPLDVVVDNGTYIIKDMKAKAIGIQEADQKDPNVTGGTDYLVAFRIALEGEAPADGFVEIYLAEKAEFGQPVKYLEDANGHPFVVRRYYHLGDKLGDLETIGIVNAKGLKEFTMHVVDSFDKDEINILPRDKGVSGIMVQALLPTSKSGLASLQYEVDTEQNIEFTRYYASDSMTTLDWLSTYDMPVSEGVGGEGADFPDGIHLNNISNLMVGFEDGRMVIKDNGSNLVDFVFGKIEDAATTRAMREKVLTVKLALTNKDAAFRVGLVKWTGNPDEYTQEIFNSRNNGTPVFQSGWVLVDSLFIPENVVSEDTEFTHAFTVPKDANNYAVIIYPESEQQPLELKLKTFNVGAKTPFYYYVLHQSRKLNELHLEYDSEFYESVQDATGLYSLRYTLGDNADGQAVPCGTHRKGKADITLDPTVNQIPSSSASGGEGALKFGKDGQVTVNTLLNIASEQAQGSNHPTEFWWVTVAADGSMTEIPGSRTTFPISGGSSGTYSMTPFTLAVEAGDRIALRAKSDMPDGAYLISIEGKVPLVDVTINFKELVSSTSDDPFADIDLSQFDRVYTGSMTAVKFAANTSSITFPLDIPEGMSVSVLDAVKQMSDESVRPVKKLDWTYSNSKKELTVSFGEIVALGAVKIGVYV